METSKASGGGRDDCWTDGATAVLIEAWGERHLRCNRANLRQSDWNEVADAVNGGRDSAVGKPCRTNVQCKNRIDTLKKKYKVEKAKSSLSNWPFFNRLDFLIGPNPNPNPNPKSNPNPKFSRSNFAESSESSLDDEELFGVVGRGKKQKLDNGGGSSAEEETAAFKELAMAVAKFGEVYERIESSKQHLVMELERQRMEFTKELEFQRMNMLIDAQLKLEKSKRYKNTATSTVAVQASQTFREESLHHQHQENLTPRHQKLVSRIISPVSLLPVNGLLPYADSTAYSELLLLPYTDSATCTDLLLLLSNSLSASNLKGSHFTSVI